MKIAFIVDRFPRLSETFILSQITGLLELGHHVEVYSEFSSKDKKIHPQVIQYNLLRSVRYFGMPSNKIRRFIEAFIIIFKNICRYPVEIFKSLNIFRFGQHAASLRLLFLSRAFFGSNFDVIQCHFGPCGILGSLLKEIGIKGKVITTFHGHDISAYIRENGPDAYNRLFRKGDLILPVSEHWKKKLIELGCQENKIIVHHMGIDIDKFAYIEKDTQKGQPVRILTVGRLVEKKGHEFALMALARVIGKHKNLRYIIAGDGPLRAKLSSKAQELKIAEYVDFIGSIDQEEIIKLYERADIFILPSVTSEDGNQEGIPVVLMEAQAKGLPIISSYHTGIPEVVLEDKSGFLVPEKDEAALAEKIVYLIEHPEIWRNLGKNGRRHIEENFNNRILLKKLENLFISN